MEKGHKETEEPLFLVPCKLPPPPRQEEKKGEGCVLRGHRIQGGRCSPRRLWAQELLSLF